MALFNDAQFSDILLKFSNNVNKKEIFCHKAILLNSGSHYFKAALSNFKEKNSGEIYIESDHIEIDLIIIQIIYQDKYEIDKLSIQDKINLVNRADYFQIDKIKNTIVNNIFQKLKFDDLPILLDNHQICSFYKIAL